MDFLGWLTNVFGNPNTWYIAAGLAFFGFLYRVPYIGRLARRFGGRRTAPFVMLAIGFIVGGGLGSLTGLNIIEAKDWSVTDLQVTTDFSAVNLSSTTTENANIINLLDVRATDAQAADGNAEVANGIVTVTRTGDLKADSCTVSCLVPPSYPNEAGDDGTRYDILEKNTLGQFSCHLKEGAAATTDSPRERTTIGFDEGAATDTLGIQIEIDEEGHDALEQYSYKDVIIDFCGKPLTFRIHRMD
jgi:hypothetical protein